LLATNSNPCCSIAMHLLVAKLCCWLQCCFVGCCNVFVGCCNVFVGCQAMACIMQLNPPSQRISCYKTTLASKQPLLPHTFCCHITFASPRTLRARRRNPRNSTPYIPPHQHVGCDMRHVSHTCHATYHMSHTCHATRHMSHRRFHRHRLCRRGLTRVRPPTPSLPCIFVPPSTPSPAAFL